MRFIHVDVIESELTVGCQTYMFDSPESARMAENAVRYAIQATLTKAAHATAACANDLAYQAHATAWMEGEGR